MPRSALLDYADGRLGLIQATTAAFPGYPERLEFFGSRGSAVYHKGQARLEWHLADPGEDRIDEAEVSSGAARPMDITGSRAYGALQRFCRRDRARSAHRRSMATPAARASPWWKPSIVQPHPVTRWRWQIFEPPTDEATAASSGAHRLPTVEIVL